MAAARATGPSLSRPAFAAGGAAALFVMAGAALITVLGDPHAGAPQVRVSLEAPKKPPALPLALRSALGPDALATPAPGAGGAVDPSVPPPSVDAAVGSDVQGQAVITLPQGGSLGGAAPAPPPRAAAQALVPAPVAAVTAVGPSGALPVIAKDGRTPFQVYARPFHDNGKPKIALIVGGLGLNAAATHAAIDRLPADVTLSFVPYADGLQGWIDQARAAGHEVLLEIPMEPLDYPNNDPGPATLMASAPKAEIIRRLEWLLARASGYFGVTNYLGGRFVTSDPALSAFTGALRARGLAFVDDGSAAKRGLGGLPRASADAVVDQQLSTEAIDHELTQLETDAQQRGQALGAGFAYPVTIAQASRWAQGLAARGYQLAPVSAITRR